METLMIMCFLITIVAMGAGCLFICWMIIEEFRTEGFHWGLFTILLFVLGVAGNIGYIVNTILKTI